MATIIFVAKVLERAAKKFVAKVLVVVAKIFIVKALGMVVTSNVAAKLFATNVIVADYNNNFLAGISNFCSNIEYLPTKNVAANSLFFL